MKFQLIHLFYLTLIVAAACAFFSTFAWLWIALAIGLWVLNSAICNSINNRNDKLRHSDRYLLLAPPAMILVACVFASRTYFGLYLPNQFMIQESLGREPRLGSVGFALEEYMVNNGSFPPAYIADKNGQPMHSWRVLILPYLGEKNLYDQYDFNQPWDSPANRRLANKLSPSCPYLDPLSNQRTARTAFKLVTGEGTFFQKDKAINPNVLQHGASQQILLVEDHANSVNWMKPEDLNLEQAKNLFDQKRANKYYKISSPLYDLQSSRFYVCNYELNTFPVGVLDKPEQIEQFFLSDQPQIGSLSELPFRLSESKTIPRLSGYLLLFINFSLIILPAFYRPLRLFDIAIEQDADDQ